MKIQNNKFINFLENLTIIVILLAVCQTFLDDLFVFLNLDAGLIQGVKLSGFFFDLYFSIEFTIRFINALSNKDGKGYFLHRNGWVDLLSSFPLLLFISAPYFISFIAGSAALTTGFFAKFGLIKMIKAIRVTRILRFLRVLKILGKIKNVDSLTAQRLVTSVTTITVFTLITIIMITSIISSTSKNIPTADILTSQNEMGTNRLISEIIKSTPENNLPITIKNIAKENPNIIFARYRGQTLYISSSNTAKNVEDLLMNNSEMVVKYDGVGGVNLILVYSRLDLIRYTAWNGLVTFFMIIIILIVLVVLFTRNLAITVTDPVYVMRLGFEKKDYTLAVKIPDRFKEEDIFKLANDYNNRWLPAKVRKLDESSKDKKSLLNLDGIL